MHELIKQAQKKRASSIKRLRYQKRAKLTRPFSSSIRQISPFASFKRPKENFQTTRPKNIASLQRHLSPRHSKKRWINEVYCSVNCTNKTVVTMVTKVTTTYMLGDKWVGTYDFLKDPTPSTVCSSLFGLNKSERAERWLFKSPTFVEGRPGPKSVLKIVDSYS